jgi:hypothetical protein
MDAMNSESESPTLRPWALYTGLAAITCSMLLLQQFLTRVFSVQLNSGLAFLAVSTTFLGLGSAGVCVYAWPRLFPSARVPRLVDRLALAYAIALVLGFVALVRTANVSAAVASGSPSTQIAEVVAPSLWMLPALFLVGLVLSLLLRAHSGRVNRLYGADLLGGGAGCLLVLPLMDVVGGDQGIFVIGAIAAAGAALLAHAHGRARAAAAGLVGAAAMLLLPLANRNLAIVDVRSHRTTLQNVGNYVLEDHEIARKWNSLSRLGFFETPHRLLLPDLDPRLDRRPRRAADEPRQVRAPALRARPSRALPRDRRGRRDRDDARALARKPEHHRRRDQPRHRPREPLGFPRLRRRAAARRS